MKKIVITVLILLSLCSIAIAENGKIIHDGSQATYYAINPNDANSFINEFTHYGNNDSWPFYSKVPFPSDVFPNNEVEINFEDDVFEKIWVYIHLTIAPNQEDRVYNLWGNLRKYGNNNQEDFIYDHNGNHFSKFEAYEKGIWYSDMNYPIIRMYAWCEDLVTITGTYGFTKAPFEVLFPGIDPTHPDYENYLEGYTYGYASNPNCVYILYASESMKEAIDTYNQKCKDSIGSNRIYVWKYVTNRPIFQIIGE